MKLLVVLSSTRNGRAGKQVSDWFVPLAQKHAEVDFADLAEVDLPLHMEETIPSGHKDMQYKLSQTQAWSDRVQAADAVVFIHPEYNHSVNAALKNAIDHIYYEWDGKPTGSVGYGSRGASDAADHLEWIGKFTKWDMVEQRVAIPKIWEAFDGEGNLANADEHEKDAAAMLKAFESRV